MHKKTPFLSILAETVFLCFSTIFQRHFTTFGVVTMNYTAKSSNLAV
ncbi:hypothetical protein L248_1617 [Schleiferilactobacillus shenzhenensis LY-73]|uniref:Uncharacterized protein n=1 Tax=Schleiferilactobacillus shenzhenensis LY-73 TaxID=1231336 RepID=U4TIR1_9LACO|nr:hypothetical protein L248_1617 [Schleiferilactobacillus shenzhenensis LY-73]